MIDKAIFALPGVGRILGLLAASAALQALAVLGQAWSLSRAITNPVSYTHLDVYKRQV